MITLNSDKGLVKVEGWEEIQSLPGFISDLNPAEHKLESIIGRYAFKDKINCGLSNCHRPHGKGYIVKTQPGLLTNIGKDCGKTHFGVDFETLSRKFDRDVTEAQNRDLLWSFSLQIDDLEAKVADIRHRTHGADWINKKLSQLQTPGSSPEEVRRKLSDMVKARSGSLSCPREATDSEIETREATQGRKIPRPYFIDEHVANIAGIEALYPENNLRGLLVLGLEENIKAFKEKEIDSLTYEDLRRWTKWVSSVEATLEKAAKALAHGNAFLSPANLEPFLKVLSKREEISLFRSYLRELSE